MPTSVRVLSEREREDSAVGIQVGSLPKGFKLTILLSVYNETETEQTILQRH